MAPSVVVRGLHKRYGAIEAVRGASFEIERGEIFGLLGPNGAGKTTTVECVMGLREPDSGDVHIAGLDARRHGRELKKKIGAALQSTMLQDGITPREALALFGSFYPRSRPADDLLEQFGLGDKAAAPFGTLSEGQRQRLAIALAFVNEPEVVFLDEPTAGLDPQARRELHGFIFAMKREGCAVLLTTHDLDEAEQLCDRVGVIHRGRLIAAGRPRDLVAASPEIPSVTLVTNRPIDKRLLADVSGVQALQCDDRQVSFGTPVVTRTVAEVLSVLERTGVNVIELHVQKSTLEAVFLELTADLPPEGERRAQATGASDGDR